MGAGKIDRRVRRTRELLRGALLSLIQDKGYDRITVQDILERADIGRSTFYAHYRDKDDLLHSGFDDIRAALAAEQEVVAERSARRGEFLEPLRVVFHHVDRYRYLGPPITRKGGGGEVVIRVLEHHVAELVREHLRASFPGLDDRGADAEAAARFVTGACMGLLTWWIQGQAPYSEDEIFTVFRRMTTQGMRRFLTARS